MNKIDVSSIFQFTDNVYIRQKLYDLNDKGYLNIEILTVIDEISECSKNKEDSEKCDEEIIEFRIEEATSDLQSQVSALEDELYDEKQDKKYIIQSMEESQRKLALENIEYKRLLRLD